MSPWENPETWFTAALAIGTIAEALVLRRLALLEKATHELQRVVEEDRKRVYVFVEIAPMPAQPGEAHRPLLGVRVANLSPVGIFVTHIIAHMLEPETGEKKTVTFLVKRVIRGFADETYPLHEQAYRAYVPEDSPIPQDPTGQVHWPPVDIHIFARASFRANGESGDQKSDTCRALIHIQNLLKLEPAIPFID